MFCSGLKKELVKVQSEFQSLDAKWAALDKVMAIIEFKPDGTIISANENFTHAVGYSLNEIIGQHHSIFVEREHAESEEYANFWRNLA